MIVMMVMVMSLGGDSDGYRGAVATGISINAEYGNITSTMHYNSDTTMQATLFIYRSNPTMQRHLYKDKPQTWSFKGQCLCHYNVSSLSEWVDSTECYFGLCT